MNVVRLSKYFHGIVKWSALICALIFLQDYNFAVDSDISDIKISTSSEEQKSVKKTSKESSSVEVNQKKIKHDKKKSTASHEQKRKQQCDDNLKRLHCTHNNLAGEKIILQKQLVNNSKTMEDMSGLIKENENTLMVAKKEEQKVELQLKSLKDEWKGLPRKKEMAGRDVAKTKKKLLQASLSKNDSLAKQLGDELQTKFAVFQSMRLATLRNEAERERIACIFEEKKQARRNIEKNLKSYKNEVFRLKKMNSTIQRQIESINKKIIETKDKIRDNEFQKELNPVEMY